VGCPPCPFLCRRRRLEPRPRETPRTIAAPGPPLAVAARLKPRPVGRRARPGRSARRFLCRRRPLEPSPRETPCSPGPPASSLRGGRRRPAGRGRSAGSEGGAGPLSRAGGGGSGGGGAENARGPGPRGEERGLGAGRVRGSVQRAAAHRGVHPAVRGGLVVAVLPLQRAGQGDVRPAVAGVELDQAAEGPLRLGEL